MTYTRQQKSCNMIYLLALLRNQQSDTYLHSTIQYTDKPDVIYNLGFFCWTSTHNSIEEKIGATCYTLADCQSNY